MSVFLLLGIGEATASAPALIELRAAVDIVPAIQITSVEFAPMLSATADIAPAVQLAGLELAPAVSAAAEVTPALRGSIVIH